MISSDSIEATASTVEEAIKQALEQLGAEEDDVTIEVVSTPRSGVLGLGARQARVRVTRRAPLAATSGVASPPPAPPPRRHSGARPAVESTPSRAIAEEPVSFRPSATAEIDTEPQPSEESTAIESEALEAEQADERKSADPAIVIEEATSVLTRILDLMGEKGEIQRVENSPDSIELNIKGDGSGILIGRHGQTLDALEYLVNRILARRIKDAAPVSVDTESYRARRRRQLHRMALSMGEQAKREHSTVTLEPMPPRDRRVIHLALKDDPLITTRSSGDGFMRAIHIVPVDERRERPEKETRERKRERGGGNMPVGQQGGFKRGQKRIV